MLVLSRESNPIGHCIGAIGAPAFTSAFHAFTQRRIGASRCHVFSFSKRSRPICVLTGANSTKVAESAQSLASDYIGGDYHSDPLLRKLKEAPSGRIWMVRTRSDALDDAYFRRKYYDGSGIGDEIALFMEAKERLIYLGLCRQNDEAPFSDEECRCIVGDAPAALNAIARHLEIVGMQEHWDRVESPARIVNKWTVEEKRRYYFVRVRDALLDAGSRLTPREAEVCAYIVQGYFTGAIARMLGISIDTVGTHRKRAYAKLGVSRQNELFSRYVDLVTEPVAASPPARYSDS